MDEHVSRHADELGIRASIREAKDGVALLESALTLACELLDDATELQAHDVCHACRNGIATLPLQRVCSIQTEAFYFDQCLCMCRLWSWYLVVNK